MKVTRLLFFVLFVMSIHPPVWALTPDIAVAAEESSVAESFTVLTLDQPAANVLADIEVERAGNETRVLLKVDGAITDYSKHQLKKNVKEDRPDRMYIDIKNLKITGRLFRKNVGSSALARIRTGRRTNGIRVVFDSNFDGLFDYKIQEQPEGLLITVMEPYGDSLFMPDEVVAPVAEVVAPEPEVVAPVAEVVTPEPEVVALVEESISPEPQAKAEVDLEMLIVTSGSPDYAREWVNRPPDLRKRPDLMKTAKLDQEINTSFLVRGLTPDIDGNVSYDISFTLLDPLGKPMINRPHYSKATSKAPVDSTYIVAEPEMALAMDSTDPLGDYRIIGFVQDVTNNKIVRSSIKITLTQ